MIQIDNKALKGLYAKNATIKAVLDAVMKNYKRNMGDTTVATMEKFTKLEKGEIKTAFRELEALNLGRYVPGRWSKPNRFEWAVPLIEAAMVASSKKDFILESVVDDVQKAETSVKAAETEVPANFKKHVFSLRPDLEVNFVLPTDFTVTEANRIEAFLKTLPYEQETPKKAASKAA